jgi:cytochrome c-type biogenesis protein CcmE
MIALKLPRRIGLVLGGVLLLGSMAYMLYGLGNSLVFYLTPSEVLAKGESAYDTPIRLAGRVSAGSVQWDADRLDLRFALEDFENRMAVQSAAAPPMMFQEGIEVVVEGRYTRSGVFHASNVMVMHSNEYRELPEGHTPPEERYRQLFGETGR